VLLVARGSLQMQDPKKSPKSPYGHHPTTLPSYIFATKACINNRKKNLLSSNISPTCPHTTVNFGPLAAEILSLVWGTPDNFNGFRVLAALLHGTLVVGVSQTAALNRGHNLYSARRPSRWALAHISSFFLSCSIFYLFYSSPNLSGRKLDVYNTFDTWCGPCANLECRSERCCTRLAAIAGPKKVAKNRHLGTMPQLCRAISSQLRHASTIGKKHIKQQYLLYMSPRYGELRPTNG